MNLLASRNGRLSAFFLLYLTEGLPLGFSATAIATTMRRTGVGVEEIGLFVGALYAPWGLKWAFGPVVDLVGSRRLGPRRGWILFAQVMMVAGLLASVGVDYTTDLKLFTVVMVAVNTFCALQDVAIDALAVGSLKEEERGLGNGLMFAGAYVGQALGGAAMLMLAGRLGTLTPAFFAVAGMVAAVTVLVVVPMREPEGELHPRISVRQTAAAVATYSREVFSAMVLSKRSIAAAVFALLPTGAIAMGLALGTTLAVELGLTDDQIATLSLVGAISGATGSVLGGLISDRTGHRRTLAVYVVLTAIPTAVLGLAMHHHGWLWPVEPGTVVPPEVLTRVFWWGSIVYGFFAGLTYGTRMAIFMRVCNPKIAATQFTAYMAMSNFVISYSASWQGASVARLGYPATLALDCAAGLLCLAVLPLMRSDAAPADSAAEVAGP